MTGLAMLILGVLVGGLAYREWDWWRNFAFQEEDE